MPVYLEPRVLQNTLLWGREDVWIQRAWVADPDKSGSYYFEAFRKKIVTSIKPLLQPMSSSSLRSDALAKTSLLISSS